MKNIILLLVVLFLSGCVDGDRFDKLIVVDGNGGRYLLKHNLGDTYFIDKLSEKEKLPNEKINEKLSIKKE